MDFSSRWSVFGDSKKEVYHISLPDNRAVAVNWEIYSATWTSCLLEDTVIVGQGSEGDLFIRGEGFSLN